MIKSGMHTAPLTLTNPTRVAELLSAKTIEADGCLIFTGCISSDGYGMMRVKTEEGWRGRKTHRIAWVLRNGPIPEGMVIDHLCGTRGCVNPDHMEIVSQSVNAKRSNRPGADTCGKCGGSDWKPNGASRRCRTCWNAYHREWQRKNPGHFGC